MELARHLEFTVSTGVKGKRRLSTVWSRIQDPVT
jgi:hypothetical protein